MSYAFAHIISPTLSWLLHGFLNSQTAFVTLVSHCHKLQHGKNTQCVFWKNNWSQASLQFRLYSTADISLPCFLSSSHACKGLVNCWLSSIKLELPYGDVHEAIDAWSEHHDSSPLQKGIQIAWDDLVCRDSLNTLLNTTSPWNHYRLLTGQESHSLLLGQKHSHCQCWKPTQPWRAPYCNHLPNRWQNLSKHKMPLRQNYWWAGAPWLSCTKHTGRFTRHSAINSILTRSLNRIHLPSTLEPIAVIPNRGSQLAFLQLSLTLENPTKILKNLFIII